MAEQEIGVEPAGQETVGTVAEEGIDHAIEWCTAGVTATHAIDPAGGSIPRPGKG